MLKIVKQSEDVPCVSATKTVIDNSHFSIKKLDNAIIVTKKDNIWFSQLFTFIRNGLDDKNDLVRSIMVIFVSICLVVFYFHIILKLF